MEAYKPRREIISEFRRQIEMKSGEVINERPRPRLLVAGCERETGEAILQVLSTIAPTAEYVEQLSSVSLSEFDCIITTGEYTSLTSQRRSSREYWPADDESSTVHEWKQLYDDHLSIIYIAANAGWSRKYLDFRPASGSGSDLPGRALVLDSPRGGRHIKYMTGLPDHIQDLVKRLSAPAAKNRSEHRVLYEGGAQSDDEFGFDVRPFLLGPEDGILAGSYARTEMASVWIIPVDLLGGDLKSWVVSALREWHELYPSQFPALPDWQTEASWQTAAEIAKRSELSALTADFEGARSKYLSDVERLSNEIDDLADRANSFERALLTSSGKPLEAAVARALREVGFTVREMDAENAPDALREDFRISDPDNDPEWLCVAEVKGFSKGVSEIGFQSLGRWSEYYAAETGSVPMSRWYIANFKLRESPDVRGVALPGREDAIEVFALSRGLLIDTRALFRILIACQSDPELKTLLRARLRKATGRFGLVEAMELLRDLDSTAVEAGGTS